MQYVAKKKNLSIVATTDFGDIGSKNRWVMSYKIAYRRVKVVRIIVWVLSIKYL